MGDRFDLLVVRRASIITGTAVSELNSSFRFITSAGMLSKRMMQRLKVQQIHAIRYKYL